MKTTIAILLTLGCLFYSLGYAGNTEATNAEIMATIDAGGSESLYTREIN